MLLFSRIDDRNAIVEHDEGDGVLVQSRIRNRVWEAIDVVVLHEVSQKGDICAISLRFGDSVVQIAHATRDGSERIGDKIPHGKVEQATHVILVIANIIYRVVVDFTDNVYPRGRFEGREELLALLKTSVKPNAVNAIIGSNIRDPRFPFAQNNAVFGC